MKKHLIAWTCLILMLAALFSGCGESTSQDQQAPAALVESADSYTVYAFIPEGWDDIRIWAWSDTEGDLFEAWPGEAMSSNGYGWYSYTVPNWVDKVIINGHGGSVQTADLEVQPQDLWILIYDDGAASVSYSDPAEQAQWEDAQPQQEGYYKVYARVNTGWSDVAIWAWSETLGDLVPEWPGVLMDIGSDGWYVLDIPIEYDNVIINGNGGTAQTEDLYTGGNSVWITVDNNGTDMRYSKPSGSSAPATPSGTGTSEYDQVFSKRGITDIRVVSGGLSLIAGVKEEKGTIQKMEYGYTGNETKEMAIVVYFEVTGMSESDMQAAQQHVQESFADIENISFCDTSWERTGNYLRYSMHFKNLDNPANARQLAAFIGTGSSGLTSDGKVPVPTENDMRSLGLAVKIG